MRRLFLFLLSLTAFSVVSFAQIYTSGAENPSIKWKSLETENYRILYPASSDSLAIAYAKSLERFRLAEKSTSGFAPNEFYHKKMPVLLHAHSATSNGLVSWAPRRMELFATPEAYDPESTPWVTQLTVHEGRHVAQMQLGRAGKGFGIINLFSGELWTGAVAGIYPGPALLEGDAVVAETSLTESGRGRTADFLEFYRVSLADSLYRDFWQWRWGSQKRYTPDHYRAGYVLLAGLRTTYDIPDIVNRYHARIANRFFPVNNLRKTIAESTGKALHRVFLDIQKDFAAEWAEQDKLREPFVEGEDVSPAARLYDSYRSLTFTNDGLVAIHSGLDKATELVKLLPGGRTERLGSFASGTSRLVWDSINSRLMWTEEEPSRLYPMESFSRLKYLDKNGKHKTYPIKGRVFNPAVSKVSAMFAVVQYYEDGYASVKLLSSGMGVPIEEYLAPAGLQPVEPVLIGKDIFASGITEEGFSIYRLPEWKPLFSPAHSKINRVFENGGLIWFTSDRDGVNNLYSVDPSTGEMLQRTSTRFGGNEFAFSPEGDLYYSAPTTSGRVVRKLPADSLLAIPVSFGAYPSKRAERLSAQEELKPCGYSGPISAPKPYKKGLHPLKLHSWLPIYTEYNPIERLTLESVAEPGGLGATALFQNELGSAYGSVGVSLLAEADTLSAGYDPTKDFQTEFRPSLHAQYVWTGWGPVFEIRADIGERARHGQYFTRKSTTEGMTFPSSRQIEDGTFVNLTGAVSLPLNFSGGGWSRGIVPYFRMSWNNDIASSIDVEQYTNTIVFNIVAHEGVLLSRQGIRAYSMRPIPGSCIFPRLGAGADIGFTSTYSLTSTSPGYKYAKIYGYLPGLMSTHGLRLQGEWRNSNKSRWILYDELHGRADYAFPFAPVDWSGLGSVAYVRNFEAILHGTAYWQKYDSYVSGKKGTSTEFTAGITLQAHLSNFFWSPYDTRIGLKYIYNFSQPELSGLNMVFSLDL